MQEIVPTAGAIGAKDAGFLFPCQLPAGWGDIELQVPGLHEDALVLLVEPLEEDEVFEAGRFLEDSETREAAALSGAAAGEAGDSIGAGHEASVAVLDQLKRGKGLGVGFRARVVEVDATSGDVLEKVALKFDAHGGGALGEMEEASDEPGDFVGKVAAKDGGFEANYH